MKTKLLVFAFFMFSILTVKADYIFDDWDVSVLETAILIDEETGEATFPETEVSGWQTSNPTQARGILFCPGTGTKCVLRVSNGEGWSVTIRAQKTPGGPDMILYAY